MLETPMEYSEERAQPWKTWVLPERPSSPSESIKESIEPTIILWQGWTPDPNNPHFKPWLGPDGWLAPFLKPDDKFFNWHGNGQG